MRINKKIILISILVLAAVFRIYRLGINPPHLTPDEAALGYNAYSILKTGKDEYGKLFPIIFKSFGDYKPGLYVYLTVPFVAILGLTEFAIRLPSALMGVAAVLLLYKIVKEFFENENLSLLSALMLAFNPWHIHFSRGAWEINFALTLTLAGVYFFLKSLKKQKFLIISAAFFGLTLLTYQGAKLSSAIVVLILLLLHSKKVLKFKTKTLLKSALVGIVISIPIILTLFSGRAGRLKVFSVFSYRRPAEYLKGQLSQGGEKVGNVTYYLFHSEVLSISRGIIGRYFNHFSGRFLFFDGDWQNPRHTAPNHGVLLLADLIFVVVGLVYLLRNLNKKEYKFVLLWLALAPLPAALSRDQVHAVRAFNMLVPYVMTSAIGIYWFVQKSNIKKLVTVGLYAASLIYYLDALFIHLPIHNSMYWEYGYKQVVEVVEANKDRFEKVHFRQSFAQPYIYYLFYTKYDPAKYQAQANLIESEYGDVGRVEKIDNIYFLPIDWQVNRGDHGVLFVADPVRIPPQDSADDKQFETVAEIKYLDGKSVSQRIIGVK